MKQRINRPVVLLVSQGAAATGFSRVADGIISHLQDNYRFHQFAINLRHDMILGDWPIYGNTDPSDAHGLDRLEGLIKTIKPDIVLVMYDLWFCCIQIQRLVKMARRPVLIGYCPVDGELTRPELYAGLGLFDQIVAYNLFGEKEIGKACPLHDIRSIPHGLDHKAFYPLQPGDLTDRRHAKHRFFQGSPDDDGFIVLNASKHQLRKRIDLTVQGFALFARDKPADVRLYLHTGATFNGPDIRAWAEQAGISERLIHSEGWLEDHPVVGDERLNLLYNASDVGINSSMGEGWGLVSFEHAATGAPQVVPGHSACKGLWQGLETVLPVKYSMEHTGLAMLWHEIDPNGIAAMLNRLYLDEGFRADQAVKAHGIAAQDDYSWDNISGRWDALFQELLFKKKIGSQHLKIIKNEKNISVRPSFSH